MKKAAIRGRDREREGERERGREREGDRERERDEHSIFDIGCSSPGGLRRADLPREHPEAAYQPKHLRSRV